MITDLNQESQTLDLANDCFRFVTGFFEVIRTSSPHIYHSALLLCPEESIVKRVYGQQVQPMARGIWGVPTSWNQSIATIRFLGHIGAVAWSPCSQFIATSHQLSPEIVILDAVTLDQLHTLPTLEGVDGWQYITCSPSSHLLTGYCFIGDCIISWDLQTGGQLSRIATSGHGECRSMSYSGCATMIGALFRNNTIITYSVLSGMCISFHSIQQPIHHPIWTHNQYLQFANLESGSIAIWQVSFTTSQKPLKFGSLSIPTKFSSEELALLPTHSQLAFIFGKKVLVWDAQHEKVLLESEDIENPHALSFSPDGCYFVCGTRGRESYLWKKSSEGYTSCQKLYTQGGTPLISPSGESVILVDTKTLQLCPMGTSSLSSSTQDSLHSGSLIVEFSPDRLLVAFGQRLSSTITILDLKTCNPWLTIDTDTKTCGLRMAEDRIIVVGDGSIITWKLPARNHISNPRRSIEDSVQTIIFHGPLYVEGQYASISPNLNYLAFGNSAGFGNQLWVYNMHTRERLVHAKSSRFDKFIPGFNLGTNEVWCTSVNGEVEQWEMVEGNEPNSIELKKIQRDEELQSGFPWHSLCDYQITNEGWILCPSGNQLLWLPHHLQPGSMVQKRWCGKLLAVWNENSLEPLILELEI